MRRGSERIRFGVTDAGKVVLRGTGFVALAALIVPAFGVLCMLVAILLAALVAGFILRPKVRIEGHLPDRVIAGETAWLTYVLKNVGRLPAYNLRMRFTALPQTVEEVEAGHAAARLGPGDSVEATVALRPTRRGCYRVGAPVCLSGFPFNLFWFGSSRAGEETLIVLPVFSRLQMPVRRLSRCGHGAGVRLAGRTGASPEYIGSRPFMPGDSPRRIDARAWARLAAPATKEYDEDCDNYAAIVLDTRAPAMAPRSKSKPIPELEAAISLCASVAFTINNDCFIDLLAAGPELHEFAAWPRAARLDRIHELLADAEPAQRELDERATAALADRFREVSQAVFILLHWDSTYQRLVKLAGQAGCHCTVVLIGEPGSAIADVDTETNWTVNIEILSPEAILSGRVKRL